MSLKSKGQIRSEDVNDTLHSTFRHLTIVCDFTASKSQETIVITFQAELMNLQMGPFFRKCCFRVCVTAASTSHGIFLLAR